MSPCPFGLSHPHWLVFQWSPAAGQYRSVLSTHLPRQDGAGTSDRCLCATETRFKPFLTLQGQFSNCCDSKTCTQFCSERELSERMLLLFNNYSFLSARIKTIKKSMTWASVELFWNACDKFVQMGCSKLNTCNRSDHYENGALLNEMVGFLFHC